MRALALGLDGELDLSEAASRSQILLDVNSTSAERVALHIDPCSPVRDGTIDATVERSYNLSQHDHLWILEIYLYYPFAAWPWIPHVLSRITPKHFQAMCVMLVLRAYHMTDDLDGMLTTMEQDDVLARSDSILQEKCLSSTVASRSVCIGICHDNNVWKSGDEFIGMGMALRERGDRWDELVRRRMPHLNGQGILRCEAL